jgi:hypothetical protein
MTSDDRAVIRTPDQQLRVFVSSTLRELADERRAVKTAIERLRLAPVMFELGARPHPPRSLYRAYLAQSDVFIGIYGDSYGWVAPDEEISGLEDEYNLAPASMPKLIYIKTSQTRDERLEELIDRIRSDDTAAYLPFESAADLEDQVATTSRRSSPSASTNPARSRRSRHPSKRSNRRCHATDTDHRRETGDRGHRRASQRPQHTTRHALRTGWDRQEPPLPRRRRSRRLALPRRHRFRAARERARA